MRLPFVALAMLVAGCNAAPVPLDSDSAPSDDAVASATSQGPIMLDGDGVLAIGNCQDTPLGSACVLNIGDPTTPGAANIVHFPVTGASGYVVKAAGTATWTPTAPVLDQIALRISILDGCPDRCSTQAVLVEVSGTSPLPIELTGFEIPDGAWLGFSVTRAELLDSGQRVSLLQPFHIEGTVELAAPETVPAVAQSESGS